MTGARAELSRNLEECSAVGGGGGQMIEMEVTDRHERVEDCSSLGRVLSAGP